MTGAALDAAIVSFWFGTLDADGLADAAHQRQWFRGGAALDRTITERFGAAAAVAPLATDPPDGPTATIARVLLLDQFPRHIHRGQALAWSGDAAALALARTVLAGRDWQAWPRAWQQFLLMPLEHAEDLATQHLAVARFTALAERAPPRARRWADALVRHAREHRAVIARFGRFPYRNAALGRASTPDEVAWLARR